MDIELTLEHDTLDDQLADAIVDDDTFLAGVFGDLTGELGAAGDLLDEMFADDPVEDESFPVTAKTRVEDEHVDSAGRFPAYTIVFRHPTPRDIDFACADADPDLFSPTSKSELAEAKAYCRACPGATVCGDLGRKRQEWGVWGGELLIAGRVSKKYSA